MAVHQPVGLAHTENEKGQSASATHDEAKGLTVVFDV
jgi:hypothetical protein